MGVIVTRFKPPEFYLWDYLKDRVYRNNPQTIGDLKTAITARIRAVPIEECVRVIDSFARRLQMCLPDPRGSFRTRFGEDIKVALFDLQTGNAAE